MGVGRREARQGERRHAQDGDPRDLSLFIKGASPDPLFDSNPVFTGTIYAPDRNIQLKSNAQVFGSLSASSITLDSNAKVHFDENLLSSGADGELGAWEILCWRRASI